MVVKGERSVLVRGGTAVIGRTVAKQDILVRGERIAAVGELSGLATDETVDAAGLLVLPGGVDTHVHFNDVFMGTVSVHDYYKGTLAAAYGGVTSLVDFSNQLPGEPLVRTLEVKQEEARGAALIDWGVHPAISDPTPEIIAEIPRVVELGAPTMKCYMTYREEGLMTEPEDLKRVLAALSEAGGMLMVHAEDNEMIEENVPRLLEQGLTAPRYHSLSKPPEVEDSAVRQVIGMVRETGGRLFIVHMSTAGGLRMLAEAKAEGLDILAETCTHYLVFTDAALERVDGTKWICSPPLRAAEHQEALWHGLRAGIVSQVSSDDAAYSREAKHYGKDRFDKCPNGIAGIEPRLTLLYSEGVAKGRISLPLFVELVASAPARLFGMRRKGSLVPGNDADIVLFDPEARWTMSPDNLHMGTDFTTFGGLEVAGKVAKVFSRGELIIDGEECLAERGRGRFIHRKLEPVQPV